ncbi:MAG TPA: metallophosphoesterase family protein [Gemmatimonadaceae bacterium]|nr:metallophosphoesterase family protein [Gemmatimonadaceae bacterium]
MRVAALYDIHGNLPALEAVLADVGRAAVDCIVVGGDIFPGPMARDVLHHVRALGIPVHYIRGNGDRALGDVAAGRESAGLPPAFVPLFEWHAAQLDRADLEIVARWPLTLTLPIGAFGEVMFCHATPRDDNELFTVSTPAERIRDAFEGVSERVVICGHTHRPFDRMIGDVRVVNAGSVGMPFGGKEAEWLLLDDGVEFRRTPYDLGEAKRRVMASDYPRKEEFVEMVLTAPSR